MTDKQFDKDVKKYIKDIKKLMICDTSTKHKFINDFKNDVFTYIDDNKINEIEKVQEHFGAPNDIAKAFFESADIKKIKRRMDIGKFILIGIIFALLIWAIFMIITVIDSHNSYYGYTVEYIESAIIEQIKFYNMGI